MRVIVSKTLDDTYTKFVLVRRFSDIKELTGVTTVIINDYEDSDLDAGVAISDLYNVGVKTFIYINEEPSATLKLALRGVQGRLYDDMFYLQDEEELEYLVSEVEGVASDESTELALSSAQTLRGFIDSFMRHEERVNTPVYLEQVKNAITELEDITKAQSTQLTTMGESALDVFKRVNDIITKMDNQHKILERQLKEFEQLPSTPSRPSFGSGVVAFPTYKYIGTSKVLLIREVAPCRYLTSFLLAYTHYLHYELNKRVKLIFVHQRGAYISKKYDKFTSITQESIKMMSLYDAEVIATNSPKQEVMKTLFSKPADIFIVVDRLYGSTDIVSGRITKLSAVGGLSDIERFKLQKDMCIFPVTAQDGSFITIPTIKPYPTEQDVRFAAYVQICQERFKKLDKFLQLQVD